MIANISVSTWNDKKCPILRCAEVVTPWGKALVVMHEEAIVEWWFASWEESKVALVRRWPNAHWVEDDAEVKETVRAIFDSDHSIDLKLCLKGTEFQVSVWKALMSINFGEVTTYQAVAKAIGRPTAVRAVANAIGQNPISWLIPCHRIIHSDGRLGGYRWGVDIKKRLLHDEKFLSNLPLNF